MLHRHLDHHETKTILERETGLSCDYVGATGNRLVYDRRDDYCRGPAEATTAPEEVWIVWRTHTSRLPGAAHRLVADVLIITYAAIGAGERRLSALPLIGEVAPFDAGLVPAPDNYIFIALP